MVSGFRVFILLRLDSIRNTATNSLSPRLRFITRGVSRWTVLGLAIDAHDLGPAVTSRFLRLSYKVRVAWFIGFQDHDQ